MDDYAPTMSVEPALVLNGEDSRLSREVSNLSFGEWLIRRRSTLRNTTEDDLALSSAYATYLSERASKQDGGRTTVGDNVGDDTGDNDSGRGLTVTVADVSDVTGDDRNKGESVMSS